MAKKRFEKICTICKKKYRYCAQCSDFDHLPRWMDAYCSQNCKDLYNIAAGWLNGWKDKDVEIERLSAIDLSQSDNYPQWLKDAIRDMNLYKESKKFDDKLDSSASIDLVEEQISVEPTNVDTESIKANKNVEETKAENHKTEKKNFNYKKNYKK